MPKTTWCPRTHREVRANRQRLVRHAQDHVVPTHAPRVCANRQRLVRHAQDHDAMCKCFSSASVGSVFELL